MKKILYLLILVLAFSACKKETETKENNPLTPVNITNSEKDSLLRPLMFAFNTTDSLVIALEDSVLTVKIKEASLILPDSNFQGVDYFLQYMKFYFPSLHQVKGKNFPGEAELFFKNADGKWAAVAFFIDKGDTNQIYYLITKNLDSLPKKIVDTNGIYFRNFLPYAVNYWHYYGSFPDSNISVEWFVYKTPVYLDTDQIDKMKRISGKINVKINTSEKIKITEF